MAVSVGGVACSIVRGDVKLPTERVALWQTAGMDGYGAHLLGEGNAEGRFQCVLYSTAAGVATWFSALEALVGSVVTVVNDWGTSYSSFLVVALSEPIRQAALHVGGGAIGRVEVRGVTVS
jgi:hypothetical protein